MSQTPFDDPGLRSAAEQALGFTNLGRDFFSAIEHPTLAASLGSLIEQPHGMPDLVEAMRGTAGASSVFSALASGHFGNVLDDYESQLASLSRIGAPDSPLADFEQSAQRLADTGNLENEFLQNLVVLGKKRSATGSQMAIRAHLSERV
ncbi:MAG: hypothetical protein HYR60_13345 [Acidobacteria bacterium]|nr:hypothetical protein [Acidobacteriota bacterium]